MFKAPKHAATPPLRGANVPLHSPSAGGVTATYVQKPAHLYVRRHIVYLQPLCPATAKRNRGAGALSLPQKPAHLYVRRRIVYLQPPCHPPRSGTGVQGHCPCRKSRRTCMCAGVVIYLQPLCPATAKRNRGAGALPLPRSGTGVQGHCPWLLSWGGWPRGCSSGPEWQACFRSGTSRRAQPR